MRLKYRRGIFAKAYPLKILAGNRVQKVLDLETGHIYILISYINSKEYSSLYIILLKSRNSSTTIT